MNKTEAFYESARCLYCYDAPCVKACPTHIDIPLFIKQIHTDNLVGATKTIFNQNWLGNACGKVCPTSELCEGACVYQHQNVPVIQIGRLQNYATLPTIQAEIAIVSPGEDNGRRVAIVGSGPAGIACACELRTLGYSVDIFEAKSRPSGLTVHGVAPYKIKNEEVLMEIDWLQKQLGFTINYDTDISTAEDLKNLETRYDAIFLGIGLGYTRSLNLPGEELEQVVGAVEFIETLRLTHHAVQVPDRVVILGGGNTAMDAASESARLGAETVILAYRRSKEEMGAYTFEYELAKSAGVRGLFNSTPVEILGDGAVQGVKFIKTRTEHGALQEIAGSEFTVPCDLVIKATGQSKQTNFLAMIEGLEVDAKKRIMVDTESYQTSNPQYFAGGDAVNGGAEVVNAAFEGKQAALGIENWLNQK